MFKIFGFERKAVWDDIITSSNIHFRGNNIESNRTTIEEKIEAIVDAKHKLSLYELFEMHGIARGEIVDSREEADNVFSLEEGITPFDINTITADYIG